MMMERMEGFRKTCEFTPNFRGRVTYISDQLPPTRAYFHSSMTEAYSNPNPDNKSIDALAKEHLILSLGMNLDLVDGADYILAAIWGDNSSKMIDIFKYSDINNWPGNPDMGAFVLRDGVYVPEKREVTCGDTLIVLGQEEKYRRTTKDLTDYMEHPPEIEGLVLY